MRFQRSAQRLLNRWADLTTRPDRLGEIAPIVVPVVQVGSDEIDEDRAWWLFSTLVVPAPGDAASLRLNAMTGDVQVMAAWASREAGTLDLYAQISNGVSPNANLMTNQPSGSGAPLTAAVTIEAIPPTLPQMFEAAADQTLELPFRELVLEQGRSLALVGANAGQSLTLGFLWRNH